MLVLQLFAEVERIRIYVARKYTTPVILGDLGRTFQIAEH